MEQSSDRPFEVDVHSLNIDRYEGLASPSLLAELRSEATTAARALTGRTIWHVNSTAEGGGVAEMLPSLLGYCRNFDIDSRWLVIGGNPAFFQVTKRLHHGLHGEPGDGTPLDSAARRIYEETLAENAAEILALVRPGDIVMLHDPQTIGLARYLKQHGAAVIWRCHIGHSESNGEYDRAWQFLQPYLACASRYVFTREAYIPRILDRASVAIVPPTIDAFTPKNQAMSDDTVRTILVHTGILRGPLPDRRSYEFFRSDGSRERVDRHVDLIRCGQPSSPEVPLVVQVSRWDPLKDPCGVIQGFVRWLAHGGDSHAELVMAGPSVTGVADDPESVDVFNEVFRVWRELPHVQRSRVHLAMLPMVDVEENAAMVNALQRHAAVIVQKSLHEGFGLTVTEAMWKGRAVLASRVGGIQDQIEHGVSGLLLDDPQDLDGFGELLESVIADPAYRGELGRAARERVSEQFLEVRGVMATLRLAEDALETGFQGISS
ncbi:MAG: glycosyltransferase [Gammaproteobacteria bacterium]